MLSLNGLKKVTISSLWLHLQAGTGHSGGILLYDRPASSQFNSDFVNWWTIIIRTLRNIKQSTIFMDGWGIVSGCGGLGWWAEATIDVCVEDDTARGCVRADHNREVKRAVQTHDLSFTAQKAQKQQFIFFMKGAIFMGGKLKLVAKITWSTVDNL
jgi:hypothetical protein